MPGLVAPVPGPHPGREESLSRSLEAALRGGEAPSAQPPLGSWFLPRPWAVDGGDHQCLFPEAQAPWGFCRNLTVARREPGPQGSEPRAGLRSLPAHLACWGLGPEVPFRDHPGGLCGSLCSPAVTLLLVTASAQLGSALASELPAWEGSLQTPGTCISWEAAGQQGLVPRGQRLRNGLAPVFPFVLKMGGGGHCLARACARTSGPATSCTSGGCWGRARGALPNQGREERWVPLSRGTPTALAPPPRGAGPSCRPGLELQG